MSWSLQVTNGDLVLGQASLGTVAGSAKLVQDLRCYILEKMGTDPLHPSYGSLLDGGIRNGLYVEGVVGVENDEIAASLVYSELRRVVVAYQAQQLARARRDVTLYGKATLSRGEILLALTNIEITQQQDAMTVTLHLTTGGDDEVTLSLNLSQ